ncbi:MAG: arginine deiminase family protein [Gemmatimonadota bacterium]
MTAGAVRITSEIGRLRRVVCHPPGPELTVVTPDNRPDFLFDDLLDLEHAAREHARFQTVLERFAEVREVGSLLAEVLADPEARAFALTHAEGAFREWAVGAEPAELARLFVEGRSESESHGDATSLAALLNEAGWVLPPLPNLFFTRDAAAVVGDRVMISGMKHEVRWTEELIMRTLFSHHPVLSNRGFLYDGTRERRMNTSIEGGDVHVLRNDLLLLGLSERTSAAGIDALAHRLFRDTETTNILVVILPPHRTSIHLDMIFSMLDRELCCIYPPYFVGLRRLPVLHLSAGGGQARQMPDLFSALREVELPLEPVFCGGERRTMQEREQWGSGCNMFAVGPGQLIAYDRNDHTLRALEETGGFRIVEGVAFLTGDDVPREDERFVITIEGAELVRGGGGPRCMTLPVLRDEAWAE